MEQLGSSNSTPANSVCQFVMATPYYQILESPISQPIHDLSLISHEISGDRRCDISLCFRHDNKVFTGRKDFCCSC